MRILLPSLILGLALPVTAQAAPTKHAVTWSSTTSTGVVLDGVTMKTVLLGSSSLYGSSPTGPWIGSSAANDVQLSFSAPVKEICVYVWWNNEGEAMTASTNGTGTDAWRAVDTGEVTTSVDGSGQFTWSAMGDADEALACVSNSAGFTTATFDHNGVGSGLVFGDSVWLDTDAPRLDDVYWYTGANGGTLCTSTGTFAADMESAGATSVAESTSWPTSFDSLERFFLACPTSNLSSEQKDDLVDFVDAGGVVVVVGENTSYAGSAVVSASNDTLSALGVDMRLEGTTISGDRATGWSTLTDGYSSITAAAASTVLPGPASEPVVVDGSDRVSVAVEGSVILSGDYNVFERGGTSYPGNVTFKANIWDYVPCDAAPVYADIDGDAFGTESDAGVACEVPSGYASVKGDCDDDDDASYPGATELVADGIDQSCDGEEICYADGDEDGWRTSVTLVSTDEDCDDAGEALAVDSAGDCDDSVASVYPGAAEVAYDGVDQDCDGEDLCDVDVDGFDDPRCGGTDCQDADAAINPGASEVFYDGVDADCDGWSDFDADYDGFDDGEDCDDADPFVSPGAEERWYDGVDQDCDGGSDYDRDGDGFDAVAHGSADCDDLVAFTFPGAPELDDGVDNDCDGYADGADGDGDGVSDELEHDLGLDPDSDDSDGDGVLDRDELGDPEDPRDSDGDGVIDALDDDDDDDGIASVVEVAQSLKTLDSDTDGTPDHLDLDSDDDGYDDAFEGDVDHDFDGVPDYIDVDSDEDGVLDVDEVDGDTDGDGVPDRLDPDDDGDGIATSEELTWEADLDGDGVPNHLDSDADGDGVDDASEGWADVDCDGIMDVQEGDVEDGPCAQEVVTSYESGCSSVSAPMSLGGLALGLLALVGLRRRRS